MCEPKSQISVSQLNTVNQLFCDSFIWQFARDKLVHGDLVLSTPMSLLTGKDWFAVRNICDKSLANHKPREKFLAHK